MNLVGPLLVVEVEAVVGEQTVQAPVASEGRQT